MALEVLLTKMVLKTQSILQYADDIMMCITHDYEMAIKI
jgi:hypothetical protein